MPCNQYGFEVPPEEYPMLVGKQLFGKPNRMLVGMWISRFPEGTKFNASQFWQWCMTEKQIYGQANEDFRRYESVGMIELVSVDRAKWYRRLPNPLWEVFRLLDAVLSERPFGIKPETLKKMVADLQRVHRQTAPTIYDQD